MSITIAVAIAVFGVAAIYASVGHGGATAYLAILSLLAFPIAEIRSTALVLNVLVAGIACIAFLKTRQTSWSLLWPLILLSIPAAYLGGLLQISTQPYTLLLALALLVAACRLAMAGFARAPSALVTPRVRIALPIGAGIGFLSGLIGIGGGVFLSPVLLLLRWADARQTAAVAAPFIVVNSLAGLGGLVMHGNIRVTAMAPLVVAAALGALIGSHLGSRRLSHVRICQVLAFVLLIAAIKLCIPLLQHT